MRLPSDINSESAFVLSSIPGLFQPLIRSNLKSTKGTIHQDRTKRHVTLSLPLDLSLLYLTLQAGIDQVWLNILAWYFPPVNEFRLEREAYVGDTAITKKQANVTISNLHQIDPHNSILMPQSTGSMNRRRVREVASSLSGMRVRW